MDTESIRLVQADMRKIEGRAEEVGMAFYARLFETHPELRPMFGNGLPSDFRSQSWKLVQMLALVVSGLSRIEKILPAVKQLALRHVEYGVREEHYPVVGQTLIWTLRRTLGSDFTPAAEAAWIAAFDLLSGAMIAAANEAAPS